MSRRQRRPRTSCSCLSGLASTAGKYAAAFALAARVDTGATEATRTSPRARAVAAYAIGEQHPGVCQTAPGRAPYFYEEENLSDDMELAAAELPALTGERRYLTDAVRYAAREPVTPWMGIPFIWCSNDLMVSFATQAYLYRRMSGDDRFREFEQAAIDWIFGANPWGISMVVGYPRGGRWPHDPHSVVAMQFGPAAITGGLVDGPVYRSIFGNLRGIALHRPDADSAFNTAFIVYHDDMGDYSTNAPIMDGTANLVYLLSTLAPPRVAPARAKTRSIGLVEP